MGKPLPWGKVFLSDLSTTCRAHALTLRQRGILLELLTTQHIVGSIPASLSELQQLVGLDVQTNEIKPVLDLFFPFMQDRTRRANPEHAKARADAIRAYNAQVLAGQMTAEKRWSQHRSPDSSPTANQNQNQNKHQNSTEVSREEKNGLPATQSAALARGRPDADDTDDGNDIPF